VVSVAVYGRVNGGTVRLHRPGPLAQSAPEGRYVVIGGIASVLYGMPRATFDLDILIQASTENARRLLAALAEAGFGTAALTNAEDVAHHEITVFNDRVRIDP